jgi:prepilin peptidase CpaA
MPWWPTAILVLIAAAWDVRRRRIPNWLVIPFMAAGLAFGAGQHGLAGLGKSAGGIGLAVVVMGLFCRLRAMGMGDLKLCAAVGAWIGYRQLGLALVVAAMAAAVMAIGWAARRGVLRESLEGACELVLGAPGRGFRADPEMSLDNPRAHRIPYAPAIAIGTLFSFFC